MQPNHANMERRQCLSSLILSSSVTRTRRGRAGFSGHRSVTDGEFVEDRVGNAGTVRFGGANENDLDDENVPEGQVARAFRYGRGRRRPGNLSATAVQSSGCTRYRR